MAGPGQFEVRTLLPPEFAVPSEMDSVISVAPIPQGLVARVQERQDSNSTAHDDICQMFSQGHLQYLFARFVSSNKDSRSISSLDGTTADPEEGAHRTWDRGVALLYDQLERETIPASISGFASTTNELLRQYATALSNHWGGKTYKKALKNLLRVLLRAHLAPTRSAPKPKKPIDVAVEKADASVHISRQKWSAQLLRLCDDLAGACAKSPYNSSRAEQLLRLIDAKRKAEPEVRDFHYARLEDRTEAAPPQPDQQKAPARGVRGKDICFCKEKGHVICHAQHA